MLAIIIPYYKLTFFEETLQSLANQTDKRFKVYIGDDASPEDCTALLQKYKGQFNFTYKRFESNLGSISLTKQWERCIALSGDEEWIMILGDDDVLSNNFVEEFQAQFKKFGEDYNVIRFGVVKINEEGKPFSGIYINPVIESSKEILFSNKRSSLSEYIFRKKQVITIGFKDFPLGWFSDVLAVLEFSNFGSIYSINQVIVQVRISTHSISGNTKLYIQKELAKLEFYSYLINNNKSKFDSNELKALFYSVSKIYLNNKKYINLFFKISYLYFKNLYFIGYINFIKKIASISK